MSRRRRTIIIVILVRVRSKVTGGIMLDRKPSTFWGGRKANQFNLKLPSTLHINVKTQVYDSSLLPDPGQRDCWDLSTSRLASLHPRIKCSSSQKQAQQR